MHSEFPIYVVLLQIAFRYISAENSNHHNLVCWSSMQAQTIASSYQFNEECVVPQKGAHYCFQRQTINAQTHPTVLKHFPSAPSISTDQAKLYKGEGVAHFYTDYNHACLFRKAGMYGRIKPAQLTWHYEGCLYSLDWTTGLTFLPLKIFFFVL